MPPGARRLASGLVSRPPPSVPVPPSTPAVPAVERVRQAYVARNETDYVFANPGLDIFLVIITCGIWGLYLFYQLMRRMREHNRRSLALLEAATDLAWERASAQGVAEELRPNFERVQGHLAVLRGMTTDFRDPAIWLILAIITGIAQWIAYIFLDGDLIKHDRSGGAAQAELADIYRRLGQTLPTPDPNRVKGAHNYVGRIIVAILTCGIYGLFWLYDLMVEGNRHFEQVWPWEDELATTAQQLTTE